ncbi:hypothetical protein BGZ63DRAFT_432516 [Mariannaea sp. PMI_226]|nr:hypothetical protein BGZ63DRAFT_432516 [Mariannaea sp. PMI_226]
MGEGLHSSAREPDSLQTGTEANMDPSGSLGMANDNMTKKLDFLPPELQKAFEPYNTYHDYGTFYVGLEQCIESRIIFGNFFPEEDKKLTSEFRLALDRLFGDKYSSVRSYRKDNEPRTSGSSLSPRPAHPSPQPEPIERLTSTRLNSWHGAISPPERMLSSSLDEADSSLIGSPSLEIASNRNNPGYATLADVPGDQQRSDPRASGQAAVAGSSDAADMEQGNHTTSTGENIDSPAAELNRAKLFLRDNDIDKTADWGLKFRKIADYCLELIDGPQGADSGAAWNKDLHEVMEMLAAHEQFEQYHYGKRQLNTDFFSPFPSVSKRLPPISGSTVNWGTKLHKENEMDGQHLVNKGDKRIHDTQYSIDTLLPNYLQAHDFDAGEMWTFGSNQPHRWRGMEYLDRADQLFNMARSENEAFDYCISKGVRATSIMLNSEDLFQELEYTSPPHDRDEPHINHLKSWSKFRGARRAALQQCLNMFDNMENRLVCSPWRTLVLLQREKIEPVELWENPELEDPPKRETYDPFAYSIAHRWFLEEEAHWFKQTYLAAIRKAYRLKKETTREEPIMNTPYNIMGPYVRRDMDKYMEKDYEALLQYRGLSHRLNRAHLRYPRKLIGDVLDYISLGLRGADLGSHPLHFRDDEFNSKGELIHIRPMEEDWLGFLGSNSMNEQSIQIAEKGLRLGHLAQVFENRVLAMLNDQSHESLFRDTKSVTIDEFRKELNRHVDGPVKRHTFTAEEIDEYSKVLAERGQLSVSTDSSGETTVARPVSTLHPEDRVNWILRPSYKKPVEKSRAHGGSDELSSQAGIGDDDVSIPSTMSVPQSEKIEYPAGMPRLDDIHTWRAAANWKAAAHSPSFTGTTHLQKTYNFMCCLGYRFGKTMHDLRDKYKEGQAGLSQAQRGSNKDFLAAVIKFWEDSVFQHSKPSVVGQDRETPAYRDVVRMAEPDKFKEEWEESEQGNRTGEAESWHLIRNGLIRESYENKSLLLPTRAIQVEDDGLVWDVKMREPVWAFAHPARRGKAPKFWSMNRWPVHLQLESTQAEIKASGPKRVEPVIQDSPQLPWLSVSAQASPELARPGSSSQFQARASPQDKQDDTIQDSVDEVEDHESGAHLGRRQFIPGVTEYWAGDTPYQKKVFEERRRNRVEPRSKKQSWWSGWMSNLRGPVDPYALPEIDPKDIPKSRPREPIPASLDESGRCSMIEVEDELEDISHISNSSEEDLLITGNENENEKIRNNEGQIEEGREESRFFPTPSRPFPSPRPLPAQRPQRSNIKRGINEVQPLSLERVNKKSRTR